MTRLRPIVLLVLGLLALPWRLYAQQQLDWSVTSQGGEAGHTEYDFKTGVWTATNNVMVRYGAAVLTADQVSVNTTNGEVIADGSVRVQQGEQIWVSEHLRYNFYTRQIEAEQFRTGQAPMFASGRNLHAEITNRVYIATNAFLTTDDIAQPEVKVRATYIKIIPGRKIFAHSATLYIEGVPVFYFPYYSRNLGEHANNFTVTPGYRSLYGPFLLGRYTWYLNEQFDGEARLDYREKRGVGAGPDVNYHLGRWGEGTFKYYYTHDHEPNIDQLGVAIPENRQRVYLSYLANPATNLEARAMIRYEGDPAIVRDFFEGEYTKDPQPNTFLEVNKFWQNFSLDTYAEPRLNRFLEVVERLPEVRLTGYRQQLGESPLYYESESSLGYYRRLFAVGAGTNNAASTITGQPLGQDYAAGRADTYHQILLPETLFGWLNVTPRVGGRFTDYSEESGHGARTDEVARGVFNTGAELSFKASKVWPGVQNDLLDVDGLRHIIEPSVNYVYVPKPNASGTNEIPQFDFELPSLRLLPIDFPDYNAIDSIDSQNVIRWGLHNKLQTKRDGQVVNLVNWDLYTDWRLQPRADQTTFADLYSDLTLKPRFWLTFESITRYGINDGQFRMAFHTLTIQPNNTWSWSLGHFYLRDDFSGSPTALGEGNSVFTSTIQYRLNENYGFRASHYFEARTGRLQEQAYTLFRDMRSWTAGLTFMARDNPFGPEDYSVSFTFSIKAYPRYGMTEDTVRATSLLGQ